MQEQNLTAEICGVHEDFGGEEDEDVKDRAVFKKELGQGLGGQEELPDNRISTTEGKIETGRNDTLERTQEMEQLLWNKVEPYGKVVAKSSKS